MRETDYIYHVILRVQYIKKIIQNSMVSRRLSREGNGHRLGSFLMLIVLLLHKEIESYQRFTKWLNNMTIFFWMILVFRGNSSNSRLRMD